MILIGQFDSPFTRRVAIAMRLYGVPFEHRPWSVWGDADQIARFNPLRRVPTVVRDDGESVLDSASILDMLDEAAGPARALLPAGGPLRRRGLRAIALATGFADKAVSLFYERLLRSAPSEKWMERCRTQIVETLGVLEKERAQSATPYWLGDAISHADIAVTCALRFTREGHPGLIELAAFPRIGDLAAQCEALDVFREIVQPLIVVVEK